MNQLLYIGMALSMISLSAGDTPQPLFKAHTQNDFQRSLLCGSAAMCVTTASGYSMMRNYKSLRTEFDYYTHMLRGLEDLDNQNLLSNTHTRSGTRLSNWRGYARRDFYVSALPSRKYAVTRQARWTALITGVTMVSAYVTYQYINQVCNLFIDEVVELASNESLWR